MSADPQPPDSPATPPPSGLAARAAHWSAEHRKLAIWGWIAFVVVAVFVGNAVGQKEIHGADFFNGESHDAEEALYDAGMRPNDELVIIQSESLTIEDPEFQAAVEQTVEELSGAQYVENVKSPLDGGGSVSEDGRTALIDFEITGDDLEAADRLEPAEAAVAAVAADHPDLLVEQFGNVSSNKELNETFTSDLAQAELISLPLTLLILVLAFGSLVAAGVPLLLAVSCVMAALALVALPSQLSPVDSNVSSVILLIGLAVGVDYSLFYIRREREERAAGRATARRPRGRGGDLRPRRADLRPHRDRRDGRHVPQRRQDVLLLRRGHDPRRRAVDVRLADRAAGAARLARGPDRQGSDPVLGPASGGRRVALLVTDHRARDAPAVALARDRRRRS